MKENFKKLDLLFWKFYLNKKLILVGCLVIFELFLMFFYVFGIRKKYRNGVFSV